MRIAVTATVLAVTVISGHLARADEGGCELAIELHGAVVDAVMRDVLAASDRPKIYDLELPAGAQLVEVALRGKDGAGAAVPVATSLKTEAVADPAVLGADPALAIALGEAGGHARYRLILQPIAAGKDVALVTRWTSVAAITGGAIELALPAVTGASCATTVHATAGAGASVTHVRVDGADTRGASARFTLGERGASVAAVLAFARAQPVAWLQDQALGNGAVARVLTVAAPGGATLAKVKRAVLVVDTSRSMDFVGRARVVAVAHAVAAALPAGATIEAIAFDRTPERVFGTWQPADATTLAAIDAALARRGARSGSDLGAALALARTALADGGGDHAPAIVVAITDGVLGTVEADALAQQLGDARAVDFYPIVLDPPGMTSPSADELAGAAARTGGAYLELSASEVDAALARGAAGWLAPAWQLVVTGVASALPAQLRAGEGATAIELAHAPAAPAVNVTDETGKVAIAVRPAPAASVVGQLALARAGSADARLFALHPFVDPTHDFAVLAATGRVAANRRAMVAGGGPYTRVVATADPPDALVIRPLAAAPARVVGTLDRELLQHLFELQLQPKAYQCFQHELGRAPNLAGTVQFGIELGRGEITHVTLAGSGDAAFDACLLDAAYALVPPHIAVGVQQDDRTIANYPLTFSVREDHPIVVAGDADSSSPLDIDSIQGGVPARPRRIPVRAKDTATPLGPLRPAP